MTDRLRIIGGVPLHGSVTVSGSKNAALPIMAAAILADEPVTLDNVPNLSDVATLGEVLSVLGLDVDRCNDGRMRLATLNSRPTTAPYRLVRRMRASFCVLGPLLARRGIARVALPGGCNLGHRPVDLHLRGLTALGADIRLNRGNVIAQAKQLRGARINMLGPHGPTVTGTANVLCAATFARGTTIIDGAAREPEIVDLAEFLVKLGARIEGAGTPTIAVHGVDQLGGTTHRIIPDRIEATTLLLAGAITRGCVCVQGIVPQHLSAVLEALAAAGAELKIAGKNITIGASTGLRAMSVTARPYPGFPSDVQSQWMALAAVSTGRCVIRDEVFPHRWRHVAEMLRLGARIQLQGSEATIYGDSPLRGCPVTSSDLRASAALVLAALAAQGPTYMRGTHHLNRGYVDLEKRLAKLGSNIERIQITPTPETHSAVVDSCST
ncbi:MAG: UDP-N-acetylglucosamine 1-carboxyvinyltransferase [Planctomycetes bacterium]|nr:UDP-N-acetylglucosamine 1-carboxyvinyltransferase [Planctomycetota bacterium]